MSIALDVPAVLTSLATRRPVFHSEADFQFELGWEIRATHTCGIRLEVSFGAQHLDLLVCDSSGKPAAAIEVKYLTRSWAGTVGTEQFTLADHNAHDLRRYDVFKDIQRVERLVDEGRVDFGYVIVLTNDARYWSAPVATPTGNDVAFRIHDGIVVDAGERWWREATSSTKGREPRITTRGYTFGWNKYCDLDETKGGSLRTLVVDVSSA